MALKDKANHFIDGLHPNEKGAKVEAETVLFALVQEVKPNIGAIELL